MDSDKETAHKGVNATKKRLVSEFKKNGGVAWLTKGREIENYVPHATLQEAVSAVSGARYVKPADGGQYDHALYYYETTLPKKAKAKGGAKLQKSVDKVKIARTVIQKPAQLDILDLRERLTKLVHMINFANGL